MCACVRVCVRACVRACVLGLQVGAPAAKSSRTPSCTQAPEITAELFVEVLGCLANLYLPEFDFFTLVCKHDLMHFLATYAQPGAGAHTLFAFPTTMLLMR